MGPDICVKVGKLRQASSDKNRAGGKSARTKNGEQLLFNELKTKQ